MAKTDELNAAVNQLSAQVSDTEGVEASAVALISGFAAQIQAAVEAALTADNSADQTSIDAANAAIAGVTQRFKDSAAKLAAALTANQ